jgi:hypothetical protein
MIVVAFAAAFLLCFGIASAAFMRRKPQTVEERVAPFVTMGQPDPFGDRGEHQAGGLYGRIDRLLSGQGWWTRFATEVEIGGIGRPPAQIALLTLGVTLFLMWACAAFSGVGWAAVFALGGTIGVR